jgi:hypothetical protein
MDLSIKANGEKIKKMELDLSSIHKENIMKEHGSKVKNKEEENCYLQMEICTMVSGGTIRKQVLGNSFIKQEQWYLLWILSNNLV